jgi:predicted MFS family arabinose efflux permease
MTAPPNTYRALFAAPDLPALLLATGLCRLGGSMFSLAVVLYALARFASPALAGWLSFAAVLPGLVIGPLAGALLDRIGAAQAIALDMIASAIVIAALVVADRLGWAAAPVAMVLVALFSLTSPLSGAGLRALLPSLAPPSALDRVNALDTAIYALVDVLGPALAGLLIGFAGAAAALAAIAAIYGVAGLAIVRVRRAPLATAWRAALLGDALAGMRAVVRQPTLRALALSYGLYQFGWGILAVAVPVVAKAGFTAKTGDLVAGLVWAAVGVAGGFGALLAGRLRTKGRERGIMALGMLATACALWPIAAELGWGGLVFGLMVAGAVAGPIDVALLTLRWRRTDPGQFGRVLSVSMSLNMIGFPLGSALAGILAARWLWASFAAAALAAALAAAAILLIPREEAAPAF